MTEPTIKKCVMMTSHTIKSIDSYGSKHNCVNFSESVRHMVNEVLKIEKEDEQ